MADTLTFDPQSEFEILETFDFTEEVQRSEETRFFTLAEQLEDYQAKVFAGKRKITRRDQRQILEESRRYESLYNQIIVFSDAESGYAVDTDRKSLNIPWITPVYVPFRYKPYSYSDSYIPLMEPKNYRVPNYYDSLLRALPRPFVTEEQTGRLIESRETLVNEEGSKSIHTLGNYVKRRFLIHEDGTFRVIPVTVPNTADDIRTKGYFIFPRGVDIPNPLINNAFLNTTEPKFVDSDDSLLDIFPSVQSILNHGIPVTTDPYGEGERYLKIYDVKLSSISWNSWKERFPPVDEIATAPQVVSIEFPKNVENIAPSNNLTKQYTIPWQEGLHERYWLSLQEDAGAVVVKLYLSKVGEAGLVPPEIVGEKLTPQFPSSTPDECNTFDTFDALLSSGIYRSPEWKDINSAVNKEKEPPFGICINNEYIQQERANFISRGKVAWRETTPDELLRDYAKLLHMFQRPIGTEKGTEFETYKSEPESQLRRDVLTILNDSNRDPEDQADAIQTLVNFLTPKDNQYFDTNNQFVVCMHTIALLRGDLEDNEKIFYAKWAVIDEGSHICKYCGETIDKNVFVAQAEFDQDGNLIVNRDAIPIEMFRGITSDVEFTTSLLELQPMFNLEGNAGEIVLYFLLGLLEILPNKDQLKPVIDYIRKIMTQVRARTKDKAIRDKIEGIFGIIGVIILLQTHDPFLIPKGTFGVRSFKLRGYPRDTDDPNDSPIIDSLLDNIKQTFKNFGATLSGPAVTVFRAILQNSKDVKKDILKFLDNTKKEFAQTFINARLRYVAPIEDEAISFALPMIQLTKFTFSPNEAMGAEEKMSKCVVPRPRTILYSKIPANVTQVPLELYKNLRISKQATFLVPSIPTLKYIDVSEKEIRERLKGKLPKIGKADKGRFADFLNSETVDAVSILTMMSRVLDILALEKFDIRRIEPYRTTIELLQTRKNPSLLRDIAKGLFIELFKDISEAKNKETLAEVLNSAIQKDVVMNMLLITKEDAERVNEITRTREREFFKSRLRELDDSTREIYKRALDTGNSIYLVTEEDRKLFAREFQVPEPEDQYLDEMRQYDTDIPEDGYDNAVLYNGGDPMVNEELQYVIENGDYGHIGTNDYEEMDYTSGYFDGNTGV